MNAFFASIAFNLRRLFDFRGRETQILFWPYVIFVYGLATAVTTSLTMRPILAMAFEMMQQIKVAADQGGNAAPAFIKAPEMLVPDLSGLVLPIMLVNLLAIGLLAAAVARRLHDKDRSGYWGLLPLPSMLLGLVLLPTALPQFFVFGQPNPLVSLLMLNNVATFGLLVALIVLLVGKGSEGPNRFGGAIGVPGQ